MIARNPMVTLLKRVAVLSLTLPLLQACMDGRDSSGYSPPVKNVILFVADGMSPSEVSFLTQYRRLMTPGDTQTSFEYLMNHHHHGLNEVYAHAGMAPDDGAAATQLACGALAAPEMLGLDRNGAPCRTALEVAHDLGKSTGLVTDRRLSHATTAAFVAKQAGARNLADIAEDMITGSGRDKVQVLLGGGAEDLIPAGSEFADAVGCTDVPAALGGASRRGDSRDLIEDALTIGYQFACTHDQLMDLPEAPYTRVLGVFAAGDLPAFPERSQMSAVPSLKEMSEKAIHIMEGNPFGFFLVVNAGHIDLGKKGNDGAHVLGAMRDADETLRYLIDYAAGDPNTLLVVASSHGSGSMSFAYSWNQEDPAHYDYADPEQSYGYFTAQTRSLGGIIDPIVDNLYLESYLINPEYQLNAASRDLVAAVEEHTQFTLTMEQARDVLYVAPWTSYAPLPRVHEEFFPYHPFRVRLAHQFVTDTKLVWAAGSNTSMPVMVMAMGPHDAASRVQGYGHNVHLGQLLAEALGGL